MVILECMFRMLSHVITKTFLILGIFYGSSALGPAIGYLAGGEFLNIYVDTPKSPPE